MFEPLLKQIPECTSARNQIFEIHVFEIDNSVFFILAPKVPWVIRIGQVIFIQLVIG